MFYRKNLPGWERAMRVIAGVVLIAFGLLTFPAAPLGYAIAAGGLTTILTGSFGFCPMCAMVGGSCRRREAVPGRYPLMAPLLPLVSKGDFAEFS